MKIVLVWFLKGMAMGAANVIPGVSGGTIAFVSGIYERLIYALRNVDLDAMKLFFSGKFKAFSEKIDFLFLIALFGGVGLSIISLAKVFELAFRNYESLTLSFFFGLIIASVFGVGRQIKSYTASTVIVFLVGVLIAVSIAFLPPATANENIFYIILCGIVAVSSMILPGLSGSYVLLLMGNYILVLQAVSSFNFSILLPLLSGCIVGLVFFSRLLSYLFEHYKDLTIAILTGFVVGSLLIIWPWKITNYMTIGDKEKAIGYNWELPHIDMNLFFALILMFFGFSIVWWLEKVSAEKAS